MKFVVAAGGNPAWHSNVGQCKQEGGEHGGDLMGACKQLTPLFSVIIKMEWRTWALNLGASYLVGTS